jgi:hypothetical protein
MLLRPKGPHHRMFVMAAVAVAMAAAAAVPAAAAPDVRGDVQVVSESPYYFEAVIEVPEPLLAPSKLGGADAVRLELSGWAWGSPEGFPLLPVRTLAVAVPEGENVRISVQGENPSVFKDVLLIPSTREIYEDPGRSDLPAGAASDRAYSTDALRPESLHEVGPASYLRNLRLVPIDVRPARYNPVSEELQVYKRLRVTVQSAGGGTEAAAPGAMMRIGADAGPWDEVYRRAAINYPSEMATRAMRRRPVSRRVAPEDYFTSAPHWLAVDVSQRGMYSVTYEDMIGAGLTEADLAGLDPSTLRLFNGGGLGLDLNVSVLDSPSWMKECAVLMQDGGDGSFDPGDRFIFYGLGTEGWSDHFTGDADWGDYLSNLHTGVNVYWIAWGGSFSSGEPLRMEPRDGTPTSPGAYVADRYKERVHVEQNLEWDPELRAPGVEWERWWWQLLRMADGGGRVYKVSLTDVITDAPCRLKARFWGKTWTGGCLDNHLLSLSFNGSEKFMASGTGALNIDIDTTAVWAVEGENRMVARVPFVVDSCLVRQNKSRVDESYLAWFELEYYRSLRARGGVLAFDWKEGISGPVEFVTRGFGEGDALIFDVTDRFEPRLVTGAKASADTIAFEQDTDGSRVDYYMLSESALRRPESLRPGSPGALRARTEPVDYIIVTGDDLIDAAEVLADWRAQHLYGITDDGGAAHVEVVDVEDIYDEFSWGLIDPVAIKDFLEYRFRSAPAGERPPSYALMFGDATWDFRDYSKYGVRNVAPSYDEGFDRRTYSQFSSDDFFCLFEGPGDPFKPPVDRFLDMAVGRLTPETPADAMELVTDKIIGFEAAAEPGPWRCKVVLAADDACIGTEPDGSGMRHTNQADDLYKKYMPHALDFTKLYLIEYGGPGCIDASKPAARADFIGALTSGAAVVNYVGHGSLGVLAQEGLFYADDVAALENGRRLGLFVTASCAVGEFDAPLEVGIAEGLVRAPGRGALAAYSATTLAFIDPNEELNAWLAEAVLPRAAERDSVGLGQGTAIGIAIVEAEARYNNWKLWIAPYKYVLLGDPASVLALPGTPYPSGGPFLSVDLDLDEASLAGGERDTLQGEVTAGGSVASWFEGTVDLLVEGARIVKPLGAPSERWEPYTEPGPTFYHGRAAVSGGRFEMSWVNPYELVSGGGGKVRAFAWNGERDALGALDDLEVVGPTGPRTDEEGPQIELSFEGGATAVSPGSMLSIRVTDPGGINTAPLLAENALVLRLYNEDLGQLVDGPIELAAGFTYDEGSSSSGRVSYALPTDLSTEERTNAYRVEVSASDNFSNRTAAELSFRAVASGELKLSDVINYPNPFSSSTTFGFRVMKEADVVLKIFTVGGRQVRTLRTPAVNGWGQLVWDGTDTAGDPVSNGVYIYKVTATSTADRGEKADFIGKAVVLR